MMTRRHVLRRTTQAATAMAVGSPLAELLAEPERRGFKIGACDWSIGRPADAANFEVARQIGLDGLQLSLGTGDDDMKLRKPEVQRQFKDAAGKAGVRIASLAIGELNNVPYKSDPRAEVWVRDSVAVMQALGVKVVLLAFFGKGDLADDKEGTEEVIRRLKLVAPSAEKAGVVLGLESWLSAEATLRIMDRVGSSAVKMYYDVRNSTERGYDICKEIRMLGKERICEFHMKENGCLLGKGPVDFGKVRDVINDIGYTGWLQIEGGVPPGSGLAASCAGNLKFLRGLFPG